MSSSHACVGLSYICNVIIACLCRSDQSSPPPFLHLNEYNKHPTAHVDMYRLRWKRRKRRECIQIAPTDTISLTASANRQREECALPPMYVFMYVSMYACLHGKSAAFPYLNGYS